MSAFETFVKLASEFLVGFTVVGFIKAKLAYMGRFQDALVLDTGGLNDLPLLHTCDAQSFRAILTSKSLEPQWCKVLEMNLLYTYYGLPSYRPNLGQSTGNPAYNPCCIILKPGFFQDIFRVYPFDSGAFASKPELKSTFFHHRAALEDFELAPKLVSAKRIIRTFYGSNENYLKENPLNEVNHGQLDFEVFGYKNLISAKVTNGIDDRASSIEVIFNQALALHQDSVAQVIVPSSFKDDPEINSSLKKCFGIDDALGYETFRGDPKEYFGLIRTTYLNFLRDETGRLY